MQSMIHEKGRDPLYKIWNATEEDMIIFFHSTGGRIVFANATYPIEKGAICFVAAGNLHYTMPYAPNEYDRSKIFIPVSNVKTLLSLVPKESNFYKMFTEQAAVYAKLPQKDCALLEKMFLDLAVYPSKTILDLKIHSTFFHSMALIHEFAICHTIKPDTFMAKAIEYINSAYASALSLDELCQISNTSKSHFCRKFKATMGITVMEYVFQTRIAAAKRLLLSTDLSISQISEECGFSSISYFCQKFKEVTGLTAYKFKSSVKSLP